MTTLAKLQQIAHQYEQTTHDLYALIGELQAKDLEPRLLRNLFTFTQSAPQLKTHQESEKTEELTGSLQEKTHQNHDEDNVSAKEADMLVEIDIPKMSVCTKPRKDGRWQGYIDIEDVGKIYKYGRSRDDVTSKLIALYKSRSKLKRKAKKQSLTTAEWLQEFENVYKSKNRPRTKQAHQEYISIICKRFGSVMLNKLDGVELQVFFNTIVGSRQRELVYQFFNSAIKKAVKLKKLKDNPLDTVEIEKHINGEKHSFASTQVAEIERLVYGHKHEFRFLLMLHAGLRPAEALAICSEDIDLVNGVISVTKSVSEDGLLKTDGSDRIVPIVNKLRRELPRLTINPPVVVQRLNKAFLAAVASMHLPASFSQYSLRHTFATRCEAAGVSRKQIAAWMGNSEEVVIKHYLHILDENAKKELQKLENFSI